MSRISTLSGLSTIKQTDTVQSIAPDNDKAVFNRIWIYPAAGIAAGGKLTANAATVFIGERTDNKDCTPDPLDPGDSTPESIVPFKIELPQGEVKLLRDVLIQGTAADGIYFKYWIA